MASDRMSHIENRTHSGERSYMELANRSPIQPSVYEGLHSDVNEDYLVPVSQRPAYMNVAQGNTSYINVTPLPASTDQIPPVSSTRVMSSDYLTTDFDQEQHNYEEISEAISVENQPTSVLTPERASSDKRNLHKVLGGIVLLAVLVMTAGLLGHYLIPHVSKPEGDAYTAAYSEMSSSQTNPVTAAVDSSTTQATISGLPKRPSSCSAEGDHLCSVNGQCTDYEGGYCCECRTSFIGNGINCVQSDMQMRVTGKVSGTINGIRLDHADLHAFLVFKDGRGYTAISRVNPELGLSLQGLHAFAWGLGWLLAVPSTPTAKNGYTITGGDFNRTAFVTFLDHGHSVHIEQRYYTGQNAENLKMHSVINGTIPMITEKAAIIIPDYHVEYRRLRPGVLKSFSNHTYTVSGTRIHFTVNETLNYDECPFRPQDVEEVQNLDISRTFVNFENSEQNVVRFAQSSKLSL